MNDLRLDTSAPSNISSRLRIGVLMGGRSLENEVSFNSGRTICDHLDTTHYIVIPLYQTQNGTLYILPYQFLHRGKTTDFEHRLDEQATVVQWDHLKELVDFIYIATHGRYAEDGTLQGMLEILDIPYLGAKVFGSALRMDKIMHKSFLRLHNISVPNYYAIYPHTFSSYKANPAKLFEQLHVHSLVGPYIIKPHNEGSSLGIAVVFDETDLLEAIEKAMFINGTMPTAVIIEEKIEGMEFSCITLHDSNSQTYISLPPTEIVPESNSHFFDYEQKYMPGRATKYTPARCSATIIEKIHHTCQRVMDIMQFKTISRIDGFVTANGDIIIIDPNSLSGMGPASFLFLQAAEINMSHPQLINHLIKTELQAYGMLNHSLEEKNEGATVSMNNKIRVAILMGGRSNEKEISLESGRNVTYKLSPEKYEAIPIFVSSTMSLYTLNQSLLVRSSTKEIESLVTHENKILWSDLPQLVDFVFIALHGGEGENGTIQGALEMLNIPYNGSGVLTSALCMDKYKTNCLLRFHGFDVPNHYLIDHSAWLQNKETVIANILEHIAFPMIVKPHDDGCSVLVEKINDIHELILAVENLFAHNKEYGLVEECITGMELTVGVTGNQTAQAMPPSQAVTASAILSIEEKFLPGAGENQTPALLPAHTLHFVQEIMGKVYSTIQCKGYARIDCFYQTATQSHTGQERIIILEINTLPGLTPATCIFHQAAEMNMRPMDFIDHIITLGFEEHHKQPHQLKNRIASTALLS